MSGHADSVQGRAVLDARRVQHVASERDGFTVCGARWVAFDLHWDTTTRIHCVECLRGGE